jgi:hypothetical protein
MHKAEKQPWLDGGAKVEDRYRFREKLVTAQGSLKTLYNAYMTKIEIAKRQAAEAERKRLQAEADQKAAEERSKAEAEGIKLKKAAPVIVALPEIEKTFVGGGRGNRASVQEIFEVEVVGFLNAFNFLRSFYPSLDDEVFKYANAYAKKLKEKTDLPGCLVTSTIRGVICDNRPKPKAEKPKAAKKAKTS